MKKGINKNKKKKKMQSTLIQNSQAWIKELLFWWCAAIIKEFSQKKECIIKEYRAIKTQFFSEITVMASEVTKTQTILLSGIQRYFPLEDQQSYLIWWLD